MLFTIVKKCNTLDEEDNIENGKLQDLINNDQKMNDSAKVKKRLLIKSKIQSVAKVSKMFSVLREEQEMILKIKNISPDGKLPRGILMEGKPAIKHAAK